MGRGSKAQSIFSFQNISPRGRKKMSDPTVRKPHQCRYCEKSFSQKINLTYHVRTHSKERPYQCTTCEKSFSQVANLVVHQRIHTGIKPFKCEICNKSFAQKVNLNNHSRTHSKDSPFRCKFCDKTFTQIANLDVHERKHFGEKNFICEFCHKTFLQKIHLTNHLQTSHAEEMIYKCDLCDKAFSQAEYLYRHKVNHTEKKTFICEYCSKEYTSESKYHTHLLKHGKDNADYKYVINEVSSNMFDQKNELTQMIVHNNSGQVVTNEVIEGNSEDFFLDVENIEGGEHSNYNHRNLTDEKIQKLLKNSSFSRSENMTSQTQGYSSNISELDFLKKFYIKIEKPELPVVTKPPFKDNKKSYECQFCNVIFSKRKFLTAHLKTHNKRAYTCEYCSKNFDREKELLFHMMLHTGDRPYLCKRCGEGFLKSSALNEHLSMHEANDKANAKEPENEKIIYDMTYAKTETFSVKNETVENIKNEEATKIQNYSLNVNESLYNNIDETQRRSDSSKVEQFVQNSSVPIANLNLKRETTEMKNYANGDTESNETSEKRKNNYFLDMKYIYAPLNYNSLSTY